MFLFLERFEAQIVLGMFLFFPIVSLYKNGLILIANKKNMRTKMSITNKSNLSIKLINVNHNNNAVTILFIFSSSLITLKQKQKEYIIIPPIVRLTMFL